MISLLIGTILCATDLWCKEQIDHKHPAVARTLHRLPRKFAKDKFRIDCVHNKGLFCNLGDFGVFWGCLLLLISSLFSGRRK